MLTRTHRVAAAATLALVGIGAACAPMPATDVSHTSRWASAAFASPERNTTIQIAAGEDDPAGGGWKQSLEVRVAQSWCDGTTWVTRQLEGTATAFLGTVNTIDGNATVLGSVSASGSETRTPAGEGCATPGELSTTSTVSQQVGLGMQVTGTGEQSAYSREDGGQYVYQDANASGVVVLGGDIMAFDASDAAGTWLWQGFWADATGLDPATLAP